MTRTSIRLMLMSAGLAAAGCGPDRAGLRVPSAIVDVTASQTVDEDAVIVRDEDRDATIAPHSPDANRLREASALADAAAVPSVDAMGTPRADVAVSSSLPDATGVDPCGGVPSNGRCRDTQTVEWCSVPTGAGMPRVATDACATGETCQLRAGRAQCVLVAECAEGRVECADAVTVRTCAGSRWTATACTHGCVASALGAACSDGTATRSYSGRLSYEYRALNAARTDWGDLRQIGAPGVLVLSYDGDQVVAVAVTSAGAMDRGTFTIRVPNVPTADDRLVFVTASITELGAIGIAVANPALSVGPHATTETSVPVADAAVYSWNMATTMLPSDGGILVDEASGSPAVSVYDDLITADVTAVQAFGRSGPSVVAWLGPQTTWSCGSCFNTVPVDLRTLRFHSQIWIGGSTADQSYWSNAVNAHEFGHWVMASYGHSPGEGGVHVLGVVSFPGLAWSEGWATWFSSNVRQSPIYFDKQNGGLFWLDLSTRSGMNAGSWPRPSPDLPLIQFMYENEVSAMLWSISNSGGGSAPLFRALASSRMTVPPFERGYTRWSWSGLDGDGVPVMPASTIESAPFVADFLDALRCDGVPAAAVDAVTEPRIAYPYPSASPRCR